MRPDETAPIWRHPELALLVQVLRRAFGAPQPSRYGEPDRRERVVRIDLFSPAGPPPTTLDGPLDLLVLTDHREAEDVEAFLDAAERRLQAAARRTVVALPELYISIHAMADARQQLNAGSPVLARMVQDGLPLHEKPGWPLADARELSPAQALAAAERLNARCRWSASDMLVMAVTEARGSRRKAAFLLHQAVERAYARVLHVLGLYAPRTHDIGVLRRLAEPLAPPLAAVWSGTAGFENEAFAMLRAAYGHRRAARVWRVEPAHLAWLAAGAGLLLETVDRLCDEALLGLAGQGVAPARFA